VPAGPAQTVPLGSLLPGEHDDALVLATYRPLLDDGTMMAGADELAQTAKDPAVEINPRDAAGFANGDLVVVSANGTEVRAPVRITRSVAPGVVFVPSHAGWAGIAGARAGIEKAEV
jgi:NADH-quinone oxidoreductase subunit G